MKPKQKIILSIIGTLATLMLTVSPQLAAAESVCGTITEYRVDPISISPNSGNLTFTLRFQVTANCVGKIAGDVGGWVRVRFPTGEEKFIALADPLPPAPTGAIMELGGSVSITDILQGQPKPIIVGQPISIKGEAWDISSGGDILLNQSIPVIVDLTADYQPGGGGNTDTGRSGGGGNTGTGGISNPAPNYLVDIRDFGSLLTRAIGWMLYFAGGIAVLFLLVGGFQYIAARGNEEATEKAKKTITGAVIGIVIIIMAYAIVTIVSNLVTRNPGA